jgi:hypothetical protein
MMIIADSPAHAMPGEAASPGTFATDSVGRPGGMPRAGTSSGTRDALV